MAVSPINRYDWLMENILFFIFSALLIVTYKKFTFSNFSYILITIFFTLHLTGAHYTYSEVPFGFTFAEIFNIQRNHFDRIVHFSFGLLLTYPIKELLVRTTKLKGFLSFFLTINIILSASGFFEIIECLLVLNVTPELGEAYLGTQGDIWDAQKDMAFATIGSIIAIIINFIILKTSKIIFW